MFFFPLKCPVQHYPWGEHAANGNTPLIPSLLGVAPDALPWAELWLGAHHDAPSLINAPPHCNEPLDTFIKTHPVTALGKSLTSQNRTILPFLLKVLCCSQPLSIQSHPDIKTAITLHNANPLDFPDSNHKPEVLWAFSHFTLMAGFRHPADAVTDIATHPALAPWLQAIPTNPTNADLCRFILHCDKDTLTHMTEAILPELKNNGTDALFRLLAETHRGDCGTFFAFLLNQINLNPGEAIFIRPNIPHAYLNGRGIECMANSNNVIRAGLTHKKIHKELLLKTLDFTPTTTNSLLAHNSAPNRQNFTFTCDEDFTLRLLRTTGEAFICPPDSPAVFLVLAGTARLSAPHCTCNATRGTAWFKPASLQNATITPLAADTIVAWAQP